MVTDRVQFQFRNSAVETAAEAAMATVAWWEIAVVYVYTYQNQCRGAHAGAVAHSNRVQRIACSDMENLE